MPSTPRGAAAAASRDRVLARMAADMHETTLEEHVRVLCEAFGVIRDHTRDSKGTEAGEPDDRLVGGRGVLWRECKSQRGVIRPEQRLMIQALAAAGADVAIWRPADYYSGRIAREIKALGRNPMAAEFYRMVAIRKARNRGKSRRSA